MVGKCATLPLTMTCQIIPHLKVSLSEVFFLMPHVSLPFLIEPEHQRQAICKKKREVAPLLSSENNAVDYVLSNAGIKFLFLALSLR